MAVEVDFFKAGMRRLAGAVCVITTAGNDGARNGLTATAVASVTISPPTLLCCINRSVSAFETVREVRHFAVNVMAESGQEIAARFAGDDDGEPRFSIGEWGVLATGSPILASAAVAFDCRVTDISEVGSHGVFFGEVEAIQLSEQQLRPLLYLQGGYGSFIGL